MHDPGTTPHPLAHFRIGALGKGAAARTLLSAGRAGVEVST